MIDDNVAVYFTVLCSVSKQPIKCVPHRRHCSSF